MRELLQAKGFIKTHTCKCAGSLQETWQHIHYIGLMVDIRPNVRSFDIYNSRPVIRKAGLEDQFEDVLTSVLSEIDETNAKLEEQLNISRQTR